MESDDDDDDDHHHHDDGNQTAVEAEWEWTESDRNLWMEYT